jgi:hypothetical protein
VHGPDARELGGESLRLGPGAVGAGVVGDRDAVAVREVRGQERVEPGHRRPEVELFVVDRHDDVHHGVEVDGVGAAQVLVGFEEGLQSARHVGSLSAENQAGSGSVHHPRLARCGHCRTALWGFCDLSVPGGPARPVGAGA